MIQLKPKDLVAISANSKYYYALLLDHIRLFGGNWSFVFHRTSTELLEPDELLSGPKSGFHAFVDFIWAKREGRASVLRRGLSTEEFEGPGFVKQANTHREKATLWFISDMALQEVKRVELLSEAEKSYPLKRRIDDMLMVRDVDRAWTPEQDPRI
jgi:hypothetical protein